MISNSGPWRRITGLTVLLGVGAVAASGAPLNLTFSTPAARQGEPRMPSPPTASPTHSRVETRPDGSKVFTHGHRYPDNVQTVTQEYDPQGRLRSAQVKWTGFAGVVLDVTLTFDESGQVVKEEGYRAPELTTAASTLLLPLPENGAP